MRQEDKQYKQLMCTFGDFMNNITNSFSICTVYEAESCTACEAEYDLLACLWVGNSKRCFAFFCWALAAAVCSYVIIMRSNSCISSLFLARLSRLTKCSLQVTINPTQPHDQKCCVILWNKCTHSYRDNTVLNSGAASSLISQSEVSVVTVTSADTSLQGIRVSKWSLSHMQAHSKHSSAHLRASLHSNQAPELLKEFHTTQDKQGWKFHTPSR